MMKFAFKFSSRIANIVRMYYESVVYSLAASGFVPNFCRPYILLLYGIDVGLRAHISRSVRFNGRGFNFAPGLVVGFGTYLDGTGQLVVGERVHFGPDCMVLTGTHEIMPNVFRRYRPQVTRCTTTIGRGCWLGGRVIVLPGVNIGEGCVIAAGSVITRDCKPNSLYAGIPAKIVKELPLSSGTEQLH